MPNTMSMSDGAAHSGVRVWLRLEGIAAFLVAISLYGQEVGEANLCCARAGA